MALQPSTSTQVAVDSILDLNGKQTYLGNSFILPMSGNSISNTSETPICVIKNPSGSGKSLFLFSRRVSSDNNVLSVRYYRNPVLNVAGSVTVPVNLRSGSAFTSVSLCYLGASITSNGTLLNFTQATTSVRSSEVLLIIDPGSSLLITAQQAGAGTSVAVSDNAWYEI